MGWSLWLTAGDDMACRDVDTSDDDEETFCDRCRNYTHNTNQMIRAAGDGRSPYEWDGMAAADLAVLLDRICDEIAGKPDVYDRYNPSNGWGTRDTLLQELRAIAQDCREFPQWTVRMSC